MARDLNLLAIADVLEKTAAYIDQSESEKIAESTKLTNDEVAKMASEYQEITGEALTEDVRSKLATDANVRKTVQAALGVRSQADSMGRAASNGDALKIASDEEQSYSKRTAAAKEAAWNNFGASQSK